MNWSLFAPDLRQGTLLSIIHPDLFPLIDSYLSHYKFSNRGTLKSLYTIKSEITQSPTKFGRPLSLAIDPSGTQLFVLDYIGHTISLHQVSDGLCLKTIGTSIDGGPDSFDPACLVLSLDGDLLVLDNRSDHVLVFDPEQLQFKSVFKPEKEFKSPYSFTVDQNGGLVVADWNKHRVIVMTRSGQKIRSFGTYGTDPGELSQPACAAVDFRNGNILVSEYNNHRISVFDSTGNFIRHIGERGKCEGQFFRPWGVTVDQEGTILVCDQGNGRLQVFSEEGLFLRQIGVDGQFDEPGNALVDREGNLIVADCANHRVCIFH